METLSEQRKVGQERGPKYEVNIEGTIYPWNRDEITVPEIRTLGSIPPGTPVEMIDLQTNVQRTLAEMEVVHLNPGLGFSKKTQFRRG